MLSRSPAVCRELSTGGRAIEKIALQLGMLFVRKRLVSFRDRFESLARLFQRDGLKRETERMDVTEKNDLKK